MVQMLNKFASFYRLIRRVQDNWSEKELNRCNVSVWKIIFLYTVYRIVGRPYYMEINHDEYGKIYFPCDKLIEGYGFIEVGDGYLTNLKRFFPSFSISKLDNLVDVGAHVGALSFPLRDNDINFIFYEPNQKNYEVLLLNTGILNSATCVQKAVSAANGFVEFVQGRTSTTGHLKAIPVFKTSNKIQSYFSKEKSKIKIVPTENFNKITETLDTRDCTLLKMDIEGAEYEIFVDNEKLSLNKIKYLVLEVHPVDHRDQFAVEQVLIEQGYNVKKVDLENGCFEIYAAN